MENKNTDSLILNRLIQIEQGQSEIREMLKQLLLASTLNEQNPLPGTSGQNKGAKAAVPKAVRNCERDDGIEAEDEDATLYFRVRVPVYKIKVEKQANWFAIPPRGVNVDTKGRLCAVFKEPPYEHHLLHKPFAIGPYIFLISCVKDEDMNSPLRVVRYLDMRNAEEAIWKNAPSLEGEPIQSHFVVGNDKIYAFGFSKHTSFSLRFIDCHKPDEGWKSIVPIGGDECSTSLHSFYYIIASTIEYDTTTIDGKLDRRARRALIFSDECRLSYDFDTNAYDVSEEDLWGLHCCKGVCLDGGVIYFLCQDNDWNVNLMAYNHHDRKWCPTPVIGLDKYDNALPVCYAEENLVPPSRLVHLGNERLCLIWACIYRSGIIHVHCTKFNVRVQQGEHYAINISTQMYKVIGSALDEFEAV